MTSSKSSSAVRTVIMAFLALWSIVSFIIIVVWATTTDMKGTRQCRSELHALQEEYDTERLAWVKDRRALEVMVWQGRANQSLLLNRTRQLQEQVRLHEQSLEACLEDNAILSANITSLENETELLKAIEANLTAEISQQQDLIEYLQHNLTQTSSKLKSCIGLQEAALILKKTAETETEACQTTQQYLERRLSRCKHVSHTTEPPKGDAPAVLGSAVSLLILLGGNLFLTS